MVKKERKRERMIKKEREREMEVITFNAIL